MIQERKIIISIRIIKQPQNKTIYFFDKKVKRIKIKAHIFSYELIMHMSKYFSSSLHLYFPLVKHNQVNDSSHQVTMSVSQLYHAFNKIPHPLCSIHFIKNNLANELKEMQRSVQRHLKQTIFNVHITYSNNPKQLKHDKFNYI